MLGGYASLDCSEHGRSIRLLNPAAARRTDPATSKVAAESVQDMTADIRLRILRTMSRIGEAHRDRIAAEAGLTEAQTWRRLSELHREGLVEDTGRVLPGRSNRNQTVYRLTTTGWNTVAHA
jgi:predicted ArsR family transcriptional regulator